ncbi:hypothetical protein Hanom_Chr08g00695961 [Helianthus anomalus]
MTVTVSFALSLAFVTCTMQSTPGMSSPRAATSVHRRMPPERDVNDAKAFSLADYKR